MTGNYTVAIYIINYNFSIIQNYSKPIDLRENYGIIELNMSLVNTIISFVNPISN